MTRAGLQRAGCAAQVWLALFFFACSLSGCASGGWSRSITDIDDAAASAIADDLSGPAGRAAFLRSLEQSRGRIDQSKTAASVERLIEIISNESLSAEQVAATIQNEFQFVEINPRSDEALFTGYYAPVFAGSLTKSQVYAYPLFQSPPIPTAHTRREIEMSPILWGYEIVWLRDPFDAYVIHVNGSARISLPDGSHINAAYSATNEMPYTSIGKLLIEDGAIAAEDMSLNAIREYFVEHPEEFRQYAWRNDRYVFFEIVDDDAWPRGSTGALLTPMRSIAADHSVYPAHCAAFIEIENARNGEPLRTLVVNQDTGGAITGPWRIDLFTGVDREAGEFAGSLIAQGRIRLLMLRGAGQERDQ